MCAIENNLQPVKDYPDWSKDIVGLINTNTSAYRTFIKQQSVMKRQKNDVDTLKADINNMSAELSSLRKMLQRIEESMNK